MIEQMAREHGEAKFEEFEKFLSSPKVRLFIREWMNRGKEKGIKKAGIVTLLLYLWLLDADEKSVLSKAEEVLGKLLGAPKFFASFLNLKAQPDELS